MFRSADAYDKSVRSLNDADSYTFSGESEYSRERSDPYQMVDFLLDRGVNFRGRGPKGFVFSDARIHEAVCEILLRDPEVDASEIEVNVRQGVVHLSGMVHSKRTKHLAEMAIENLPGVGDILNQLKFPKGIT